MRFIQPRSAPAEKFFPSEASTTTRTSSRAASCPKVARNSAITASSKALCFSGRLRITRATPRGLIVEMTVVSLMATS
jgi:hypothetical protein